MEYVDCLTTHPSFEPYVADSKNGRIIYVFHITPDDVITSKTYQSWIKRFGGKTQVALSPLIISSLASFILY